MDDHLTAAGACWDSGSAAGQWIAPLLDEFGATLGHAVPLGYEAYAVVPIPWPDDQPRQDYPTLEVLLDELSSRTGEQVVHAAIWEGWGWMYDRDDGPRTAAGMGVLVFPHDEAALQRAQEAMARRRVARPAAAPLELPGRRYYLWSGPLSAATALKDAGGDIPTLIWPEDRSWFIGAPIYTSEIALGSDEETIRSVLDDHKIRALHARRATRSDVLDGDG